MSDRRPYAKTLPTWHTQKKEREERKELTRLVITTVYSTFKSAFPSHVKASANCEVIYGFDNDDSTV
jgi:hypothetical protein